MHHALIFGIVFVCVWMLTLCVCMYRCEVYMYGICTYDDDDDVYEWV